MADTPDPDDQTIAIQEMMARLQELTAENQQQRADVQEAARVAQRAETRATWAEGMLKNLQVPGGNVNLPVIETGVRGAGDEPARVGAVSKRIRYIRVMANGGLQTEGFYVV